MQAHQLEGRESLMLDLVIYLVWLATGFAFVALTADTIVRHWRITRRNRARLAARLRGVQASPGLSMDNGRID
jgi:hypothetical protein